MIVVFPDPGNDRKPVVDFLRDMDKIRLVAADLASGSFHSQLPPKNALGVNIRRFLRLPVVANGVSPNG